MAKSQKKAEFDIAGVEGVLGAWGDDSVKDTAATVSSMVQSLDVPAINIPIEQIHHWNKQPRKYFDPLALERLAGSFKTDGFQGTLLVRPTRDSETDGKEYLIVYGERRWRAAKLAGLVKVPCVVAEEMSDEKALEFAMGENLLREDLSKLEEAEGLLAILETQTGLKQQEIIALVNTHAKSRYFKEGSYVGTNEEAQKYLPLINTILKQWGIALTTFRSKHLQVLNLPAELKEAHLQQNLDYSKALEIGKIPDVEARKKLLQDIQDERLTSLTDIKADVKLLLEECKREASGTDERDLRSQFRHVTKQIGAAKTWKTIEADAKKKKKVQQLMEQLQQLIAGDTGS